MTSLFQSKVIHMCDYRSFDLSRFVEPFQVDEELIQEGFDYIRKKYAGIQDADSVKAGDSVTFSCESTLPKYNKSSISVNVGKGLYSKELETQMVGMNVGETRNLEVDGEAVRVTVKQIQRRVVPVIDDAFVDAQFPGLHTVEDLRQWYRDDQLEQYLKINAEQASAWLLTQVVEQSQLQLDEGECQAARQAGERSVREMWEMNGIPLDTMTEEQAEELLGYPNAQSYIDWFADLCEQDVASAALGEAAGYTPTEEEYEKELALLREETTNPEDIENYTFIVFARQKCSEYYMDLLKNHIYEYLKERTK